MQGYKFAYITHTLLKLCVLGANKCWLDHICASGYVYLPTNYNDNHRDINLNEYGLQLYFAQDYEVQGETKTIELKPGGKNIPVTEENKEEYVE